MDTQQLQCIVEAALMASESPLNLDRLAALFVADDQQGVASKDEIRTALERLRDAYTARGVELVETGSGFRFQTRTEFAPWVNRLWEARRPRYSRALLETLAIIAYKQPITRGEIEDIRGVAVSTNIIRTLLDREWIKEAGHRDVPGRPALLTTTREFLDYFGLKRLGDLPTLTELRDLDAINFDLFSAEQTVGNASAPASQNAPMAVGAAAVSIGVAVAGEPAITGAVETENE